ncbi:MAG: thiamine pyrophosphate-dependent dehydrogenase E1 component subunit alpha [Verrucomicrobia bacterium]|jgi:TPP-dependent pyruvate/acetoin dehydrogenase alpha subunit|nr:thiamine pyrophosphate-dependent dehydrogenase E1 component subunit alpha [Verrucomicrobiota bacterium]
MKELKEFYGEMLLLRRFDQLCRALKMKDIIYSGYHPYEGQEGVAVGFCAALRKDDVLLSTHRPHCHAVAKGCSIEGVLTEMMGRRTGCSGGLGGAMQFLAPEDNFYCGSVVGSNLGIATGFGMAMKQKKLDSICMCLFGDGASNHGTFHEALNLAAIWKLPVVFVCENNQFAEAMPVKEFVSCERISMRARGYGLEEITVDANDVEEARAAANDAIERCRKGEGPVLIEAVTYRILGHYVGDPEKTYRDPEEVVDAREREPLKRAKDKLLQGGVESAELESMDKAIEQKLAALEEWALKQEFPTLEEGIDHVGIPLENAPEVRGPQSLTL